MNSLWIAINLVRRTIGRKKGFLFYAVLPTLAISLVISLLGQSSSDIIRINYVNLDQGDLGKHLLAVLSQNPSYELHPLDNEEEARQSVVEQKASVALVISPTFTESVWSGSRDKVKQYQLTLNEATVSLQINTDQEVKRIMNTVELAKADGSKLGEANDQVKKIFAQQGKRQIRMQVTDLHLHVNTAVSGAIGLLLVFMMGLVNSSIAMIMEDRRQRTMMRMYSAPVRAYEIALGNFMGSWILGTLQVLSVLLFTRIVLSFDYGIPFISQFIVLEFFLLAAMGISSSVAGMVRNSSNLSTMNSIIFTPMNMIGGCFWPVAIMPEFMQKLSNFVPQKWALEAINKLAAGEGLADIGFHLGILALFGAILLAFGSVILKPAEAETN